MQGRIKMMKKNPKEKYDLYENNLFSLKDREKMHREDFRFKNDIKPLPE